jgi:hypothetical protein
MLPYKEVIDDEEDIVLNVMLPIELLMILHVDIDTGLIEHVGVVVVLNDIDDGRIKER